MARAFISLLAALVAVVAIRGETAYAEAAASREYQLKAAFLYNFAQFVEWPDDAFDRPGAPLVIGVVGQNPFGGTLEQAVRGKSVNGRPLVVRYFASAGSQDRCHILFVCASERANVAQILEKAGNATLTAGDYDQFTQDGGMFRFFAEDNKIRFEVNLDAARRSRLRISAKLLKLAKIYGQ